MNQIFIRYENYDGSSTRQEIAGFQFDGMRTWVDVGKLRDGHRGEIKCVRCGANNWTDNGRSINEYECGCCGSFITVEPKS
ncbi:hypothetical protein [Klebsiella pneumoniae]|uniref:hypothetical protein n=1 Tax=Klebsiella pneumoniae TaxID=573 RepID=UPI0023FA2FA7|nr:hypothetical protein [Klebsiella pneumoniae]MDF7717512.1 hypothetical protein [Klebsiella pneumoniae]MDO0705398.1 hypothetical protein [Klebsiella pneumoniae]HBX1867347.1 hypothetical protein [Klebsiella pneumoniae]HBX1928610.1 hypothetical protein [Klebsiella pneumoniae]HBX2029515.1 hypothetical protein [Klebsiella pneumoniae]